MSDRKNLFPEKVELSEIVLRKTDQAFDRIRQEEAHSGKSLPLKRSNPFFKKQAAALAGVCILAISSISAAAAIHHYWGRGMNGNLQASDAQQQALTESGIAKVYRENPDDSSLSVTDNQITVAPETVIVDERFAYLSFRISGYRVPDGAEPGFEKVNVYLGEDPNADNSWLNMGGTMYNGIVSDENGMPVYEDGSPLKQAEDGSLICYYTDENGDMEYILQASIVNTDDSLLGKTLHVDFQNLGTFSKASFTPAAEGSWNFTLLLPDVSSARNIPVKQAIEGTGFVMEDISISPISIKVNYSVSQAVAETEDGLGIPQVKGVVLKDGTRIPYLTNGGGSGYTDSSKSQACQIAGYDRVIEVDQVAALIVLTSDGGETVEIPIAK